MASYGEGIGYRPPETRRTFLKRLGGLGIAALALGALKRQARTPLTPPSSESPQPPYPEIIDGSLEIDYGVNLRTDPSIPEDNDPQNLVTWEMLHIGTTDLSHIRKTSIPHPYVTEGYIKDASGKLVRSKWAVFQATLPGEFHTRVSKTIFVNISELTADKVKVNGKIISTAKPTSTLTK